MRDTADGEAALPCGSFGSNDLMAANSKFVSL